MSALLGTNAKHNHCVKNDRQNSAVKVKRKTICRCSLSDHFLEPWNLKGSTITSTSYFNTLIHLQNITNNKCSGLLKQKSLLLHENATPHSEKLTQSLLNQLKWDVFCHLVFLRDLLLSDYHLILGLKCDLGSRHFATEEDPLSVVAEFFAELDAEWLHP